VVKALSEETVHRTVGRDVLFLASYLGENVRIDSAGRLLLPEGVRAALGTSHQRVYLACELGGSVSIFSQELMDQRMAEVRDAYDAAIDAISNL
jgi:DNA-binding transcriptional regulator/RsmH inhibitor MraZ